ncbi:MAG: outer membrane beta-barrel protein [Rhodanobacter sp.]
MNKLLLLAAAMAVATPMASMASQSDSPFGSNIDTNQLDNFFVAGNLGTSQYRDATASNSPRYRDDLTHSSGVFQNLRFGWRWNGIVGPEIGYAYFGKGKKDYSVPDRTYSVQPKALTVGVNGKYNFYGDWFVTGHAGWLRSRTTVACTTSFIPCGPDHVYGLPGGPSVSNTSNRNGWYGGLGVGYDVTPHVSVGLNYDNYDVRYNAVDNPNSGLDTKAKRNIAAFSGSVEYRF